MRFIADFHLHSKYSRATSFRSTLENFSKWMRIKGIKILGTSDFTHPEWFKNLKEKLEEEKPGLFKLKKEKRENYFILTGEVSCVYSKNRKLRKIHLIIFAPSFSVVEKINNRLNLYGNLSVDGRPTLNLDAKELLKMILDISEDCLVVPAHCLLPNTLLHCNPELKEIKDVSVGDLVYTHKGRYQKVKKIYKRYYKGKIINIRPYYFRIGLKATPEHPFYVIKTNKNYQPQWVQAKDIEKADVLIFPRFNNYTKDVKEIKLNLYLSQGEYKLVGNLIKPNGFRTHLIPNVIEINKDFCRLAGYYISEGYTDSRDSISFCFNIKEKEHFKDLKFLMKKIFHLSSPRIYKRKNTESVEIIYFSKILTKVFGKLFYNHPTIKRAPTKCLPSWMLNLPLEKQVEILKGWWRGDSGYTSSRTLMNQMKIILLRLGIIPSILEDSTEAHHKRGKHKIGKRKIIAKHNSYCFSNLSFFKDPFDLLKYPSFKKFKTKLTRGHGWIDEKYIYIPVRDIEITNYKGYVYNLEVENDNSYITEFATVHNCWTPWYSIFGSKSGFDSIEECFEDYSKYVFAGETGLSSNPEMNWRLSSLDKITLISCSDAHSPENIGREACVFEGEDLSYKAIVEAIKRTKNLKPEICKLIYTIEFFPEEGKYHFDGHRNCGVSLHPRETKKYNGICPVCGKPLTIGVLNRVESLADRPEGFKPENAIPFKSLVPLKEIISDAIGQGAETLEVEKEYKKLIENFGNEFEVLLNVKRGDLEKITLPEIAEGIIRVREGKVQITPGYDGVYGKIRIFSKKEKKTLSRQKTLF